jgi:hypothetical protein
MECGNDPFSSRLRKNLNSFFSFFAFTCSYFCLKYTIKTPSVFLFALCLCLPSVFRYKYWLAQEKDLIHISIPSFGEEDIENRLVAALSDYCRKTLCYQFYLFLATLIIHLGHNSPKHGHCNDLRNFA